MALTDEQIAVRLAAYTPPDEMARPPVEVAIAKYAKLVGSAAEGAIVR